MELTILDNGWEGLLFDRGRSEFYPLENARIQDVDTSVDSVADELNRFLDEAVDS